MYRPTPSTLRTFLQSAVLSITTLCTTVVAQIAVTPGARLAIVGDSITEQKLYSKYIEAYLLACSGIPNVKVFQFGWGGETASGFAGRLETDLSVFRPNMATICYGMNDGRYQPYTTEIGQAYEQNMRKVISGMRKLGVQKIVVGSPGAVDTKYFQKSNFAPLSGADGYNQSLAKLRDIGGSLAAELGLSLADVHQPMMDVMARAKAELGEEYDVCGRDGLHPGPNGHLIMAYAFLRALGFDGNLGEIVIDMKGSAAATDGHKIIGGGKGAVEVESVRYPFCFEGEAKSPAGTRSITPFLPFNQDLNRLTLKVRNLSTAGARVTWGEETRDFTREQLREGVNLMVEFSRTPFDKQFEKLLATISAKQIFETYMTKEVMAGFRRFKTEAKEDRDLAAAMAKVVERLAVHHQRLDGKVRETLVPVKSSMAVFPVQ